MTYQNNMYRHIITPVYFI